MTLRDAMKYTALREGDVMRQKGKYAPVDISGDIMSARETMEAKYREIEDAVAAIVRGTVKANLMICGMGGIGKTFSVEQAIKKYAPSGYNDYSKVTFTVGSSFSEVLRFLIKTKDFPFAVLDDSDAFLTTDNQNIMNTMKHALDLGNPYFEVPAGMRNQVSQLLESGGLHSGVRIREDWDSAKKFLDDVSEDYMDNFDESKPVKRNRKNDKRESEDEDLDIPRGKTPYPTNVIIISNLNPNQLPTSISSRMKIINLQISAEEFVEKLGQIEGDYTKGNSGWGMGEKEWEKDPLTGAETNKTYPYFTKGEFKYLKKIVFSEIKYLYRQVALGGSAYQPTLATVYGNEAIYQPLGNYDIKRPIKIDGWEIIPSMLQFRVVSEMFSTYVTFISQDLQALGAPTIRFNSALRSGFADMVARNITNFRNVLVKSTIQRRVE